MAEGTGESERETLTAENAEQRVRPTEYDLRPVRSRRQSRRAGTASAKNPPNGWSARPERWLFTLSQAMFPSTAGQDKQFIGSIDLTIGGIIPFTLSGRASHLGQFIADGEAESLEAAQRFDIAPFTADRHWTYARAWLYGRIVGDADL